MWVGLNPAYYCYLCCSIGPVDLTEGTTSSGDAIPTVLDNAFAQGSIDADLIGISFEPTTELEVTNGVLTFGGVDESKFTGDLAYVYAYPTSAKMKSC